MHIHKFILFLIFIFFNFKLEAQEKSEKAAKYKSLSERSISIDQSVPSLLQEADRVKNSDPSKALDLVEQALATSITQKSTYNEAKCYIMLGKINEGLKEPSLAIQNYSDAYQRLAKSYQRTADFIETLEGLGRANFELKNFNESKRFYESLISKDLTEDKRVEYELRLAEIDLELGQAPKARERVSQLEPSATYNKSNTLRKKGKVVKARSYADEDNFEAAEQTLLADDFGSAGTDLEISSEEEKMNDIEADELINIYKEQNKKEEEIELREKIAVQKSKANQPLEATKQRQAIGEALIQQGKTNEAIDQLNQALVLAEATGNFEEQANASLSLAESYKKSGQLSKAVEQYEMHSKAIDNWMKQQEGHKSLKETLLRKQQDIQELTKDLALDESSYLLEERTSELQAQQLEVQRVWIYGLVVLLVLVILGSYLIYRKAEETKRVGQLLALKSLRSQMNPHFIFNALNSVNQFIALNDERAANKFLSEFSKLMRIVLDNSQKEFISLREEKEMLGLYLKLEHYRFRDHFEYEFNVDSNIDLDEIDIPPMLIQPYIENAIWHGLRYKNDQGKLKVEIVENGNGVKINIEDDGIGREASKLLKTSSQKKGNSVGLKNTNERIAIINNVYNTNFSIHINNLHKDKSGTKVEIIVPTNHG